jgi:methionyl-tRNA synthetase
VLSFTNKNFKSEIVPAETRFLDRFTYRQIIKDYQNFETRLALKQIVAISAEGNKYFQDNAPWQLIKTDKEAAHQVVSNSVNLVRDINILLKPILPVFTAEIEKQLGVRDADFSKLGKNLGSHRINEAKILITNIDNIELAAKDPFSDFDLRVAEVVSCKSHPNANKLVVLELDLGKGEARTICAGIRQYYTDQDLTGKHIIIVYNLKPAQLRGIASKGMLLAASTSKGVIVIEAPKSEPGEPVFAEGIKRAPRKEITIEEFAAAEIFTNIKGLVAYNGKLLKTEKENITGAGIAERAKVR